MKQRPIDLLPESIRARSQAGITAGRYVACLLIAVVLLGLTATHSRLMLDLARQRLKVAEDQADIVLSAEAKARKLRDRLRARSEFVDRYELIALPVQVSRVVATVINLLPQSASIDRLDMYTGVRRGTRSARGRTTPQDGPLPRVLTGELSGFTATDEDVADIVANLESLGMFEQVNLDFSRSRMVRKHNAREFRISFQADLDARYEVLDQQTPDVHVVQEATGHVE